MKIIFNKINYITTLILLLASTNMFAEENLSNQLKTFHNKLDSEVKELLVYYADNNQYLNSLEMQQAAYIASKVDEWEIAGFYYIARPMIAALSQKSVEYDSPLESKGRKSLRKYWKQLDKRLKPLRKNTHFKELRNKARTVDLAEFNQMIKLKLINNTDIISKALVMYEKWIPKVNSNFHHISTYNNTKAEEEINAIFNQLNEIYVKANQDFIKLLAIPRYKELKLLSYNGMEDFTKKLNEGKVDFNQLKKDPNFMKKMMAFANNKTEMEQIEIDNLLFPEIAWGSWY